MADSNVPSVNMANGRSEPCRDDKDYGSGSGSEGVGSVLGGIYSVKKNGQGKGRPVGDDGRPKPELETSFSGR